MTTDQLKIFKDLQKQNWALFTPIEIFTTPPAADLVKFANLNKNNQVLDVGCGTGVVAITAARMGCRVSGIDICPALIARAKENAVIADHDIDFQEGDVEALPFPDSTFDAVLSQFGHMFAPRPQVAISEMLRVLKPGGTIAFSTWPPELYVGKMFKLVSKFSPAPEWVSPPPLWGETHFVRQQLNDKVKDLIFHQGLMNFHALSFGHYRKSIEDTLAPLIKLVQESNQNSDKLQQFRKELEELIKPYYVDNSIRQHFLMTRAVKS